MSIILVLALLLINYLIFWHLIFLFVMLPFLSFVGILKAINKREESDLSPLSMGIGFTLGSIIPFSIYAISVWAIINIAAPIEHPWLYYIIGGVACLTASAPNGEGAGLGGLIAITVYILALLTGIRIVSGSPNPGALRLSPSVIGAIQPAPATSPPAPVTTKPESNSTGNLAGYYRAYQDPFVQYVRAAFNGYLNGGNGWTTAPELLMGCDKDEDGLGCFSKDYYRSKFIVWAINSAPMGGEDIDILFLNKPDKVFTAWVYKLAGGQYDFRGFWQNPDWNADMIGRATKIYPKLLEDKEHER